MKRERERDAITTIIKLPFIYVYLYKTQALMTFTNCDITKGLYITLSISLPLSLSLSFPNKGELQCTEAVIEITATYRCWKLRQNIKQ